MGYKHDTRIHGRYGLHIGHIVVNFKPIILALLLVSCSAFASYGQLVPPVGWSESQARFFYKSAATEVFDAATGRLEVKAAMNVGGRSLSVPVAMRLAANAPRVAATFAYLNPAVIIGLSAITAYAYYQENLFRVEGGQWVKTTDSMTCVNGVCKQYGSSAFPGPWFPTPTAAAKYAVQEYSKFDVSPWHHDFLSCAGENCNMSYGFGTEMSTNSVGITSKVVPPSTSSTTTPVSQLEFEETMASKPLPPGVPRVLPIPLPVDPPLINPTPAPESKPSPLRVPMGEPQPVPSTSPQQYRTPVVDIVPAPTPLEPWRVDVQPKDLTTSDPAPLPQASTPPVTPPAGTTTQSKTETPDLCKENPDILACSKPELDTPDEDQVPTKNKEVSITPAGGFGSSGGSCPAGKTLKAGGIQLSYQPVCDFMSGLRPVVIALAWLGAGLILLGLRGQTS